MKPFRNRTVSMFSNWSNGPAGIVPGAPPEIERTDVARMFDGYRDSRCIAGDRSLYPFPALLTTSPRTSIANAVVGGPRRRRKAGPAPRLPPPNSTMPPLDAAEVAEDTRGALAPVITAHPTETRCRTVFDAQTPHHRADAPSDERILGDSRWAPVEVELRRQIPTPGRPR